MNGEGFDVGGSALLKVPSGETEGNETKTSARLGGNLTHKGTRHLQSKRL
jgi:hypothetical protein